MSATLGAGVLGGPAPAAPAAAQGDQPVVQVTTIDGRDAGGSLSVTTTTVGGVPVVGDGRRTLGAALPGTTTGLVPARRSDPVRDRRAFPGGACEVYLSAAGRVARRRRRRLPDTRARPPGARHRGRARSSAPRSPPSARVAWSRSAARARSPPGPSTPRPRAGRPGASPARTDSRRPRPSPPTPSRRARRSPTSPGAAPSPTRPSRAACATAPCSSCRRRPRPRPSGRPRPTSSRASASSRPACSAAPRRSPRPPSRPSSPRRRDSCPGPCRPSLRRRFRSPRRRRPPPRARRPRRSPARHPPRRLLLLPRPPRARPRSGAGSGDSGTRAEHPRDRLGQVLRHDRADLPPAPARRPVHDQLRRLPQLRWSNARTDDNALLPGVRGAQLGHRRGRAQARPRPRQEGYGPRTRPCLVLRVPDQEAAAVVRRRTREGRLRRQRRLRLPRRPQQLRPHSRRAVGPRPGDVRGPSPAKP